MPFKSPKTPKPQDVTSVASNQQKYGLDALRTNISANRLDQTNAYGSQKYKVTGQDQYGNNTYGVDVSYSPEEQAIFDKLQQSRGTAGQTGGNLLDNTTNMYSEAPNFYEGADSLTKERLGQHLAFMQPQYEQQTSWKDNQLRNQGIMPGTEAYNSQMREVQNNQNLAGQEFASKVLPQSFNESVASYQLPLNTVEKFMQLGAPGTVNSGLVSPPQINMNQVDYQGISKTSYDQQMAKYMADKQKYDAMLKGVAGIAGGVIGLPGVGGALGGTITGGLNAINPFMSQPVPTYSGM